MSDDTISRQAAIDALIELSEQRDEWDNNEWYAQKRGIDAAICAIEDLPSAERRGRWTTERTMEHDGEIYCDQCGWTWEAITHGRINVTRTPFCPNCGARMRMTRE